MKKDENGWITEAWNHLYIRTHSLAVEKSPAIGVYRSRTVQSLKTRLRP